MTLYLHIPQESKIANVNPIQGHVLNNDINFHNKIYSFDVITQILANKIIKYITIKASFATRVVDPNILKLCPEEIHEPIFVCDQYVTTFVTRKNIEFCNTAHVESMENTF